jgi:hypothetical protein
MYNVTLGILRDRSRYYVQRQDFLIPLSRQLHYTLGILHSPFEQAGHALTRL